jgi:hypothetical protein
LSVAKTKTRRHEDGCHAPPNENIENNPMQRNNVVDALGDPAKTILTRRANQRHYFTVAYCSALAPPKLPLHNRSGECLFPALLGACPGNGLGIERIEF